MKKRIFRQITALTVSALFAASLIPAALANVQDFNDVAGHWGEEHLTKLIQAGVIAGDGKGNAMPDKAIERYEAAIMLSKVFGLNSLDLEDAVTGHYSDITAESLYVDDYINNIIAAGFMVGTGGAFEPNRGIPRDEAFTAVRNAFRLPDAPEAFVSAFPDFGEVPDWAEGHILAMEAAGMIAGKNGLIAPADAVSRAEFATLLAKAAGVFIDEDTDFDGAELERAIIRSPGLTADSLTAEFLVVAQGVGSGDVTLDGCDVGVLYLFGGGTDSVYLTGTSVTELVINTSVTGGVRVVADEGSLVESVKIYSEGAVLDGDGEILNVVDYTAEDGGADQNPLGVTAETVHESVTAAVASREDGADITLTGELDYEDNIFRSRSALDFEAVVGDDGRPLPAVLNGAFTAVEINLKAVMAAIGFETVDISQSNLALSAYAQDGGSKINQPANITVKDGVWLKETEGRVPAEFDDEFNVLVLGGEIATLQIVSDGRSFTLTIDATGLTVNGADAE
ncbi:MAG: S-layer homology domain-containing protein [Oscillospiraceae bacterium]|nr:S-layer homology domain-containing protein [Oscillospiraceae bacterium]